MEMDFGSDTMRGYKYSALSLNLATVKMVTMLQITDREMDLERRELLWDVSGVEHIAFPSTQPLGQYEAQGQCSIEVRDE